MSIGLLKGIDTQLDALDKKLPQTTVERQADNLPQSGAGALFTVVGGKVRVLHIVGEVTTEIQTQPNATKLVANPAVGADADLCATVEITGDVVGTMYNITGTVANAMIATTSGRFAAQVEEIVVAVGTIDLNCAASSTGQAEWVLQYIPLNVGATVVAA